MNATPDRFYLAHTALTGDALKGTYRVEYTSRITRSFDDDRTIWSKTVDHKGNVISEFFDLEELTREEVECIKRTFTPQAVLEEGGILAAEFVRDHKHYEGSEMPVHEKFGQCTFYEDWNIKQY